MTIAELRAAFEATNLTYRDAAAVCECTSRDICDLFNDRLVDEKLRGNLYRLVIRTRVGQINMMSPSCPITPAGDTDIPQGREQSPAGDPKPAITKKGETHAYKGIHADI